MTSIKNTLVREHANMIIRILLIAVILVDFGWTSAQQLKVGASTRVITPDPLLPVSGGIGTPKPTKEKKGDLYVRAVVFEKGTTRMAIVSVDNLGWTSALGDRSRALITGITAENVLIGATHTHSAPDAYGFPDAEGKSIADLKYLEWCIRQIADAVNEATSRLEPASLRVAVGDANGKIAYNYYADQLYDPRCGVIQATSLSDKNKGKTIVTLVNYAIHPEVIGSDKGILSPDLCGPLCVRLEEKAGGVAIFMNGAQGGMVTADVRKPGGGEENTWEECKRIGQLLADESLRIISGARVLSNAELTCLSRDIEFPVDSEMMRYILAKSPIKMTSVRDNKVTTRLNFAQIGDARILTIPGEALPNIGYYLKRKMNTDNPFLFGLTNDAFGYILTRVDFNSFKRYEYISKTSLGEMTGEIYIREAENWLNEILPSKQ